MKWFNALQLTALFAGTPWGMQLLHDNGYQVASWIVFAAYCVGFVFMTIAVRMAFDKD